MASPRMPDGQPDLEGTSTNAAIVKLRRFADYAKAMLTEQEAKERSVRPCANTTSGTIDIASARTIIPSIAALVVERRLRCTPCSSRATRSVRSDHSFDRSVLVATPDTSFRVSAGAGPSAATHDRAPEGES